MASQLPKTMRAWQYNSTTGGLENNLQLNPNAPVPTPKSSMALVRVLAMAFNPVDYKPAEVGLLSRLAIKKPAIPGVDFVGRVVTPAAGSTIKEGQLVFGMAGASPLAGGALADYALVPSKSLAAAPAGMAARDAATIGVCGMTAYQSIVPFTKAGSRVFINGGSGGTGVFGIQIAKIHGCHVTTSCSTANVELCRSLGADDVVDYKKGSVVDALKQKEPFDHIVDNVGHGFDIFWRAHEYSKPGTKVVWVGGKPTMSFALFMIQARLLPGFLGGGKRPYQGLIALPKVEQMDEIAGWIVEGKMKTVVDGVIAFADAPEAVRRQKTSRAKGKILVDVALEEEEKKGK